MKIGELARLSGVTTKTIRYYESIGLLPDPVRTPSGYRDFDESYVDRLTFIRTSQRLGITLHEVKEMLLFRERGEAPCAYVRSVLDTQLEGIDRRMRELEFLREQLTQIVSEADPLPAAADNCTCQLIEHARQKASIAPSGTD